MPAGFVSFCLRFPSQCEAPAGTAATIALDKRNWALLARINDEVNHALWPVDDKRHYGIAEYWTVPSDGYGDCEDYALTKRKQLIEAGLPELALRIAVVTSPQSGRHAVLTVTTDHGDLVLDNLSDRIRTWSQTGYAWIERQDGNDPMRWVWLTPESGRLPADVPTATAPPLP